MAFFGDIGEFLAAKPNKRAIPGAPARSNLWVISQCLNAFIAVAIVLVAVFLISRSGQMQDIMETVQSGKGSQSSSRWLILIAMSLAFASPAWRLRNVYLQYAPEAADGKSPNKALEGILIVFLTVYFYLTLIALYFLLPIPPLSWWSLAGYFLISFLMLAIAGALVFQTREPVGAKGGKTGLHFLLAFAIQLVAMGLLMFNPGLYSGRIGILAMTILFVWLLVFAVSMVIHVRGWHRLILLGLAAIPLLIADPTHDVRLLANTDPQPTATSGQVEPDSTEAVIAGLPETGPIFLIAADGGGIRAAYWTNAVLGRIAEAEPNFVDHVAAMGGASGGSVGIGVFGALMASGVEAAALRPMAKAVLSEDYLSSAVAYLLFRDPVCAVIAIVHRCIDDRATSLEKRMETVFGDVLAQNSNATAAGNLMAGVVPARPLMFFNTSESGTARPYIIAHDTLPADSARGPEFAILPANRFRLSTAVFLSARFPVISPQGRMDVQGDGNAQFFVDGGYADNTGVLALHRLFEALDPQDKARVRVISISNDPYRWIDDPRIAGPKDNDGLSRSCTAREMAASGPGMVSGVIQTLDAIRSGQSDENRKEFFDAVLYPGGSVIHVNLSSCREDWNIPLGWTLSETARQSMDALADGETPEILRFVRKAFEDTAELP